MCMSVAFFFSLMIWLVVVGALYAIIKLVIPAVLVNFGGPGTLLAQAINIFLWAALLIVVLYLIWDLVDCLVGGGIRMPALPHR